MQTDLSYLPMTAQNLIALIGAPLTLRLIDALGGRTINLYNSDNSLDRMAELIGRDGAQKLLSFFGNTPFSVPVCKKARDILRHRAILAEYDRLTLTEGLSGRASIARIVQLFAPVTDRTIYNILKTTGEMKVADPRQMSLI